MTSVKLVTPRGGFPLDSSYFLKEEMECTFKDRIVTGYLTSISMVHQQF